MLPITLGWQQQHAEMIRKLAAPAFKVDTTAFQAAAKLAAVRIPQMEFPAFQTAAIEALQGQLTKVFAGDRLRGDHAGMAS